MKTVRYSREADKALAAMPKRQADKIETKIDLLATHPEALANKIKALKGTNALRLRVDDYRVIFTEELVIISILAIGRRNEIYR